MSQQETSMASVEVTGVSEGRTITVFDMPVHDCISYRTGHKVHFIPARLAMSEPFIAAVADIEILGKHSFACSVNGERAVFFTHDAQSFPLNHTALLRGHSVIQFLDE
ncbi:hypothetical protein ACXA45_04385 [Neomicrococcus lactis]